MEELATIIKRKGRTVELSGNQRFYLKGRDKGWLIEAGSPDIFGVRMKDGEPVGMWTHIFRGKEGNLLLGNDGKDNTGIMLFAVGKQGSRLREFDLSLIKTKPVSDSHTSEIDNLVNSWIADLYEGIGKGTLSPRFFQELKPGTDLTLPASSYHIVQNENLWIKHTNGKSLLMDRQDWPRIAEGSWIPVPKGTWLKTETDICLTALSSTVFAGEAVFWPSVEAFNNLALSCIQANMIRNEQENLARMNQRIKQDQHNLSAALAKFARILMPGQSKYTATGEPTPLYAACRIVGEAQHMSICAPKHKAGSPAFVASVDEIARNSKCRMRRITLTGRWWNADIGPMLVFRESDQAPLAMIPRSPTSYDVIDPSTGTRSLLTRELSKTILPYAVTFYRPFPEKALQGGDLARFGLAGCFNEVWTILLLGIAGAFLGLLTPILTGYIIDVIIPEAARNEMFQIAGILFFCGLAISVFNFTRSIALLRIQGKLDISVMSALWDRLLALPVPFFRRFTAGDLATRAMGLQGIYQMLSGQAISVILSLIFSVFNLALLFYYSMKMAFLAVGLTFLGVLISWIASAFIIRYQRIQMELQGKNAGTILQLLLGISKIRVSGVEDRAFGVWADLFSRQRQAEFKASIVSKSLITFYSVYPIITSMLIYMWFVWKTSSTQLSTGQFLAFNAAFAGFQAAIQQAADVVSSLLQAIPIYERSKPILEEFPETDESKSPPGELSGNIQVHHVFFRYDSSGPLILKDLSIRINPGEFVGIVGDSGSGKSTLFRLLLGFETPESGTVFYDGQDLRSLDIREVRQQMGVVLQNDKLMPSSIFKNITGAYNLTIDDAWEAARMVGISDDIEEMPMGMQTFIAEGGTTFSGGQRQRLLIARALVRRPRILFMDEATSALDNRTQQIVSQSLEQLRVTRVVIAHRLSTIINADRIYVIHKGEMTEMGTYGELMAANSFFARLAKRQLA
ncbi:MAG: NHLP bacteriocin export ABC transporter permease/ATPase subunit [Kiritimatiellae bacterium]|nr:NHLP bacteriocin export ABC transporter permease/ATPase subunit [Kiritimatiellia bacterium]MDD5521994.1 NHLP bacteriocin export ABC transporter permease/ATPase subunit [Kiritimatiellia bacterium]